MSGAEAASMSGAGGRVYDLCVVGAGMIGSAAARHASEDPGVGVCLVGPGEPQDRQMNRTIFGAHYDEGRITRALDPDPTWALLAQRSIRRYRDLERKTGIKFFHDVGFLVVGTAESDYVRDVLKNSRSDDVTLRTLSRAQIREMFPYLDIGEGMVGLLDSRNCGHVSPRRLVSALQTAAHLQGCDVVDDVVSSIEAPAGWARRAGANLAVRTETGAVIHARRVLLATGAFTTFRRLLPPGLRPDVRLTAQTVALVEISESDADRLQRMPSMVYRHPTDPGKWYYILPPIRYPDGKYYLKIGHGGRWEALLHSEEQVRDWFLSGGDLEAVRVMAAALMELVTGVKPLSVHGDACVTVKTPTEQLYVAMVTPSLGVALGGNGWAAKSCDEIGRMAAKMILKGQWNHDLPGDRFRVRWVEKTQAKSKL
ncbi:monomeric sarcosine oxidase-like isoform X1 [Branchiostoma floridae x Branchiostoma belcheri]